MGVLGILNLFNFCPPCSSFFIIIIIIVLHVKCGLVVEVIIFFCRYNLDYLRFHTYKATMLNESM